MKDKLHFARITRKPVVNDEKCRPLYMQCSDCRCASSMKSVTGGCGECLGAPVPPRSTIQWQPDRRRAHWIQAVAKFSAFHQSRSEWSDTRDFRS